MFPGVLDLELEQSGAAKDGFTLGVTASTSEIQSASVSYTDGVSGGAKEISQSTLNTGGAQITVIDLAAGTKTEFTVTGSLTTNDDINNVGNSWTGIEIFCSSKN